MKHDKGALVASWKRRSCQDLKAAKLLIGEEGMQETTLFHLQQAIEKALKAYLIWCAVNFPHTHDLEVLVDLAREQDAGFDRLDSVTALTDFAVAGRYPESDQWIDDCDPSDWMVIVQHSCDFIWQKIRHDQTTQ